MYVWNDGEMPSELNSTDKLFMKHSSKPYNPKLAGIFFKSGMIEAWGRGFDKIREACAKYNAALPEYTISESGIMVLCKACDKYLQLLTGNKNNSLISDKRTLLYNFINDTPVS
jgi:ATP-dependent DNA helicase RecG